MPKPKQVPSKRSSFKGRKFVAKRQRTAGSNLAPAVKESTVVEFDDLANYCASLVNSVAGQKIKVFNVALNKMEFDITSPTKASIVAIKWCSIGNTKHKKLQQLALCCENGCILIYSLEDGQVVLSLAEAHNGPVTDFVCHKDFGFSSSMDGKIGKWHLGTGKLLNTWKGNSGAIYKLSVVGDRNKLISGANVIKVWSTEDCKSVQDLVGHTNRITCLASSSSSNVCLSAAHQDRFINVSTLSATSEACQLSLSVDEEINHLLISPLESVVGVTEKGTLAYWSGLDFKNQSVKSLVKPTATIQYLSQSKVLIPIAQATFCSASKKFVLARGDTWNLSFESIKFPERFSSKLVTYDCVEPDSVLAGEVVSNVLSPKVSVKSGASINGAGASVSLTLGEKLGLLQDELNLQTAVKNIENLKDTHLNSKEKTLPELADSVARVLTQALHTKDINLLNTTLSKAPMHSIVPTIECISQTYIPALFQFFVDNITQQRSDILLHTEWLKALFTIHSSYLVSIPGISSTLGNLINASVSRTQEIGSLARLKNKLELIASDSTRIAKRKATHVSAAVYLEGCVVTPANGSS
ncbi:Small subunit (SSU) processome component [Entomophthora muscae]|uniref:Small subunit (SSU) processome component n=1 Tax=Entomophthora muscae TaxID=34485 RepID=A0ACC2UT53_9FUNG|nr:Small subunit (SSU) processome component [Entomophthora muscae]